MPAETDTIPLPKGWGEDARRYLESKGLVPIVPTIRSSDFESVCSCPFKYYLTRRLGLKDALRYSEAMSTGSWFHKRFEYFELPPEQAELMMDQTLEKRCDELRQICKAKGIPPDPTYNILEREERDRQMAWAWFKALRHVNIPHLDCSVVDYLNRPYWKILGHEIKGVYKEDGLQLVAQYDMLLYHKEQNAVWIVDLKTVGGDATERLQVCPIEFQTQHYCHVTRSLMENEVLQPALGVPSDAKFGGFIHIAIRRPTIKFGLADRDFIDEEHTLKSGPRKGQIEIRRKYSGEPRFSNYVDRCKRWYLGEGEFVNNEESRIENPVVNISTTYADGLLDEERFELYRVRLDLLKKYATINPLPKNFPMSSASLRSWGQINNYLPFYLTHPREWPDIIQQNRMVCDWRDKDMDESYSGITQ